MGKAFGLGAFEGLGLGRAALAPVVLGLGESVAVSALLPAEVGGSSTLQVEFIVSKELSGLGNIALVVSFLLGGLLVTDLLVLVGSKTVGDIRARANLSLLELWR